MNSIKLVSYSFLFIFFIISCYSGPKIEFKETKFDFGKVKQKSELKHNFLFKNTGTRILTIDQIKPTCGCTGVLLSNKDIPVGGEGNIEVTLKIGTQNGKTHKTIYVYANDKNKQIVKIDLEAFVIK